MEDSDPDWREHATVYIYNHPELFHLHYSNAPEDHAVCRWTVDIEEDYRFMRRVFECLQGRVLGWRETLSLINSHPEWSDLNSDVRQKAVPKDVTGA